MNSSPLRVLGVFEKVVSVNNVLVNIRFLVVPDETMSHAAILGLDYMLLPSVKVTMGREFKIETTEIRSEDGNASYFIGQIMQIDCSDLSEGGAERLNINPEKISETVSAVKEIYDRSDAMSDGSGFPVSNVEMTIKVTSDQPIVF